MNEIEIYVYIVIMLIIAYYYTEKNVISDITNHFNIGKKGVKKPPAPLPLFEWS